MPHHTGAAYPEGRRVAVETLGEAFIRIRGTTDAVTGDVTSGASSAGKSAGQALAAGLESEARKGGKEAAAAVATETAKASTKTADAGDKAGKEFSKELKAEAKKGGKEAGDAAAAEVDKAKDKTKKSGKEMGAGLAAGIGGAVGGLVGRFAGDVISKAKEFVGDSVAAFSDLSETVSKSQEIFGDAAADIEAFGSTAAKNIGQSKQAAIDAATTFGVFGKAAGLSGKDLSGFASQLTNLSSDLASFGNTSPEEAANAIASGLRGESEPLRKYGVLLDDASLKAEALKQGLIKTTKDALTPQQKVLAAQGVILKQTSDAQGDFSRTSGQLANSQRTQAAEMEDAKAKLGEYLAPLQKFATEIGIKVARALGTFLDKLKPIGDWMRDNQAPTRAISLVMGGLAAAIALGSVAMKAWGIATKAASVATAIFSGVQKVLNTVMKANPIILVVSILIALGLALVAAYKKSETFRNIVDKVFKTIRDVATTVGNAIVTAVTNIGKAFDNVKVFIQNLAKNIENGLDNATEFVTQLPGRIVAALGDFGSMLGAWFTNAWGNVTAAVGTGVDNVLGFFSGLGGRILTALGDLGATIGNFFVSAWQTVQTFVVTTVTDGLKFYAAIGGMILTALGNLGATIGQFFVTAWTTVYNLVAGVLSQAITFYSQLPGRILTAVSTLLGLIGTFFTNVWNGARTITANIVGAIVSFVTGIPGRIMAGIGGLLGSIGAFFTNVWNSAKNITTSILNNVIGFVTGVPARFLGAFSSLGQGAKDLFTNIMNGIRDAVQNGVNAVKTVWDKIINVVKTPIGFVVDKAINPLIGGLNTVTGIFGIKAIPKIPWPPSGWAAGGYFDPGRHGAFVPGVGRRDSAPAMLMPGEGIITKDRMRALGGRAAIDAINRGVPIPGVGMGMASYYAPPAGRDPGARAGGFGDWWGKAIDKAKDVGTKIWDGTVNFTKNTLKILEGPAEWFNKLIDLSYVKSLGTGVFAELLTKMPKQVFDGAKNWIVEKAKAILSFAGPGGGGNYGWEGSIGSNSVAGIIALAKKSGVPYQVTSTVRGAPQPGSGWDYHMRSNAVDFAASERDMERLAAYFMQFSSGLIELIHSGGKGYFVKEGKVHPRGWYGGATEAAHFNHVHVAATNEALARIAKGGAMAGAGLNGSGNLDAWIRQAVGIAGVPRSWESRLKVGILRESNGDPRAVNNWDINSKNGDPSKGLMQTIGATFAAYRDPRLPNDIFNPIANIVAGIRYILARYGSIFGVQQFDPNRPPMGYAAGGPLPGQRWAWVGERGPELIRLNRGGGQVYPAGRSRQLANQASTGGTGGRTVNIQSGAIVLNVPGADPQAVAYRVLGGIARAVA